jgi:hypothetical protein
MYWKILNEEKPEISKTIDQHGPQGIRGAVKQEVAHNPGIGPPQGIEDVK